MTEQQKAEAYVREKLPELMELSDGCVVLMSYRDMHHNEGGSEEWGEMEGKHTGVYFEDRILSKAFELTDYDRLMQSDFKDGVYIDNEGDVEETRIKIIGHPIQLQHWLRVLPTNTYYSKCISVSSRSKTMRLDTDRGLSVSFNLTKGQPATEADFRSFNDIMGI